MTAAERATPAAPATAGGRSPADSGWEGLARRASQALIASAPVEDRRELLVAELAGSRYAIAVERVREIVRVASVTRVPRTPDWLVGVVALRGEVVQVVDLRRRLGLPSAAPTRASRIVVIHGDDDGVAGLLVDSVRGVTRVPEHDVIAAHEHDFRSVVEMVRDGEGFVGILDLARVVGDADA